MNDFLCSDHLLESFDGRSYTYGSVLKSNFYHKTTQQDGHYRANPSNHELLTVRGVDCRVSKKMFLGLIPPYCTWGRLARPRRHVMCHTPGPCPQYAAAAAQYVLDNADTVNNVNIAIYYWEGANPEIISQN